MGNSNANLRLTMSRHDFIVAIKLWLAVHLCPTDSIAQICVCAYVPFLDIFGDQLLGCGYVIKCHDALHDVLWHALLVNNKGARRERRCSGVSQYRPGDVYHPDFLNGKSFYFDVCSEYHAKQLHICKHHVIKRSRCSR